MTESVSRETEGPIALFTIGFAGKSAEEFFTALRTAGVERLIDVRLNNVSQLAGFTKRRDLEYFLRVIAGIEYEHNTDLAPTSDILDAYKKKALAWEDYERRFVALLDERAVADGAEPRHFDRACLLCSEPQPDQCHRRLVAEYLQRQWPEVVIEHL